MTEATNPERPYRFERQNGIIKARENNKKDYYTAEVYMRKETGTEWFYYDGQADADTNAKLNAAWESYGPDSAQNEATHDKLEDTFYNRSEDDDLKWVVFYMSSGNIFSDDLRQKLPEFNRPSGGRGWRFKAANGSYIPLPLVISAIIEKELERKGFSVSHNLPEKE